MPLAPSEASASIRSWPASWDSPRARAAAFLAAALLWTLAGLNRSLWQDEFHSLYHAQAASVGALLESVRGDNHPPLSFLLQRASLACFGETAFGLRCPSLLAGLGLLVVFARLSRRLVEPAARGIAPWLAAGSSYLLCTVSAARMYALLALATLGLVESVLAALEGKRSRWWIAAWVGLGLHTHYSFFHHLALLGLAGLALCASSAEHRRGLARCLFPGLLGLLLFLPWGAYAFLHQLGTGDPPTASYRGFQVWLESYAHLLFLNSWAGGALVEYGLALPGALVGAVLGISGALRLARGNGSSAPAASVALLALGVVGPSWLYLASLVNPRSGFHIRYLASFAAPALWIVAAGVPGSVARRVLAGFLLAAMLGVALVNALTGGRQDMRGAVGFILDQARPGDAVLARSYWFRDTQRSATDYGWYFQRLARGREGPVPIPVDRAPDALEHPRVWLIYAGGYPRFVLAMLNDRFATLETFSFGPDAIVHLYSDPREDER